MWSKLISSTSITENLLSDSASYAWMENEHRFENQNEDVSKAFKIIGLFEF